MSITSNIYLWPVPGNISPVDTLLRNGLSAVSPTFSVDWTTTSSIPASLTFSRASAATYYNSSGVLTSASSGTARIEYNPDTLAQQGLLLEEQRTNLLIQSTSITNAAWSTTASSKSVSGVTGPDGTAATLITATASTSAHEIFPTNFLAISTGANYAETIYAHAGTRNYALINIQDSGAGTSYLSAVFDLTGTSDTVATQTSSGTGATLVSTNAQYVGNGWFRIGLVGSVTGTGAYSIFGMATAATGNTFTSVGEISFAAAGTETINFAFPDKQLGASITSSIWTTTAAATRSADIVSSTDAGLLAAKAWVVEVGELRAATASTLLGINTVIGLGEDSTNHLTTADGGVQTTANTGTWTGQNRGGIAWDATSRVSIDLDGGTVVTAANTAATPTALYFGATNNGTGAFINGHLRMMAAYTALTDLQLPILTVVGSSFTILSTVTYTLAEVTGTYALSGNAASVFVTRTLAAATGAYVLTGSAATVFATRKLAAATGTYALTGSAASVFATRKLAAVAGTYALTGQTATTFATRKLSAATGTYAFTGQTATLIRKYVLSETSGAYALTGQTASVKIQLSMSAVSGSYFLTGSSAPLKLTIKLPLTSGAYSLTGSAAATFVTRKLSAVTGAYALTGSAATTVATRKLAASTGAYALTGSAAQTFATRKLASVSGAYLLTGQAATLTLITGGIVYTLAADTGNYNINGSAATITAVVTSTGIYTVSGEQVVDHLPLQDGVEVVRAVSFPGSTTQRQTAD